MKTRQALKILRKHMSRERYDRGGWYRQSTFERACRVHARAMKLSRIESAVTA